MNLWLVPDDVANVRMMSLLGVEECCFPSSCDGQSKMQMNPLKVKQNLDLS